MGRRWSIRRFNEEVKSKKAKVKSKKAKVRNIFLYFCLFTFYFCLSAMLIVLTTTPNIEEAETLAEKIVNAKLAACVQILPEMKSFYSWKGKVQKESEHLLLIKTLPEKFAELEEFIQVNHSYDVPEIVALPAEKVSENYLEWMKNYLK
jgi:periplasmic divalent cation tolerance protein